MSNHSREKHNGSVSSPGHKAAAPPPKNRNQGLRADFLLNFQRPPADQRRQAYAPPPRRTRQGGRQYTTVPFSKGRFVQSSFRIYVDELTPDVVEAAINPDSLVRWESVQRVDLQCKELPKCPICLEVDMIVPKITRCGHVFCAPCVMRYLMMLTDYNKKTYQRCPVCNEQISPEELTSARFEESKALRPNDRATFILAYRDTGSNVVRLSAAAAAAAESPPLPEDDIACIDAAAAAAPAAAAPGGGEPLYLPSRGEQGWHFSRLVRLLPGEAARLLEYEVEALESFRMVTTSEGDKDVLPSIDAALAIARRRRRERAESGGSTGPAAAARRAHGQAAAAEDLLLPAPAVDLPEEAEEDADYEEEVAEDAEPTPGTPASGPCAASPAVGPSSSSPALPSRSTSSPGLSSTSPAVVPAGGRQSIVSFYQAADGRQVFLEPFFTRLLLHEHGGRWDSLPPVLEELRLERLQEMSVSEDARRRNKFLQHLPLGTVITLAEVDLRNHLGPDTKNYFAEEFSKRRQQRKKDQMRSKKEERLCKSRAAEEEERYYQALNVSHNIPVQQVPTAEDFVPLPTCSRPSQTAEGEGEEGAGATGEGNGEGSDGAEEDGGPTLADKIKGKITAKAPSRVSAGAAFPGLGGQSFPELGGGSAGSTGMGAAAVPASSASAGASAGAPEAAATGRGAGNSSAWGRGRGSDRCKKEAADGAGADEAAAAGQSGGPADEQPTFGEALEAAFRLAAEADQPSTEGAAGGAGGKKKKGRAGKATTIRLFG